MAPSTGSCIFGDGRQRDLLPLPELGGTLGRSFLRHLSRGCRQRVNKKWAHEDRCRLAVAALNTLACGEGVVAPSGCSGAQSESTRIISEVVCEQVPPPVVPSPDEALRLLLRSGSSYDSFDASLAATGVLASFGSGELA